MSGRKWIPAEWLEESVPTCGVSPDDFLLRGPDGVLFLSPIDPPEADAADWPRPTPILPGQEVEFSWLEDRGYATLVLRDDGSWYCDPEFEGEANCISDDEGDIIAESVADYVDQRTSPDMVVSADRLTPGRHQLDGWYWSDGIKFRVKVLESGAASFEEVVVDGS